MVKHLCTFLQTIAQEWWNAHKDAARKKVNALYTETLNMPLTMTKYEHTFVRRYGEKVAKASYTLADAILNEVRSHPGVRSLAHNGELVTIGSDQEIELKPGIWFAQKNLQHNAEELTSVTFSLWTTQGDAKALHQYESTTLQTYIINQNNQLGSDLYYFDQWSQASQLRLDERGQRAIVKPTCIRFTKHLFTTGRNLRNMFFRQRNLVQQRFQWFMKHKAWYDERGIPHTLGLLLHGAPGCGKTSTIKAIANESQRHIVNVNFARLNSKTLMKKLFYDPNLTVVNPDTNSMNTLYVPIDKRVFVVEDADAVLESVLLKRTLKNEGAFTLPSNQSSAPQAIVVSDSVFDDDDDAVPEAKADFLPFDSVVGGFAPFDDAFDNSHKAVPPGTRHGLAGASNKVSAKDKIQAWSPGVSGQPDIMPFTAATAKPKSEALPPPKPKSYSDMVSNDDDDELDLATLLNILDGTLETPGRILILTSNHPELFDEAFLRPGRMDLIVRFEKCDANMLHDMVAMYYDDATGTQLSDDKLWEECRSVPENKWTPAEVSALLLKHQDTRQDLWEELRTGDPSQFSLAQFN
jgi:DNA polymerase III delta prime subunit